MYYVYILLSLKDPAKYYIGLTTNLRKRIEEHNRGNSTYSKSYMPWKLETFIAFSNKSLAEKFEKYLKIGSGFAFLKKRFLPKPN